MNKKKVKIILKGGICPQYATERSSGADIYCKSDFILKKGERTLIHTGIYMQLPDDVECQVRSRSGLALKHGIIVLNSPGTIDSDYQGECNIILMNTSDEDYSFRKGDRIAQFVFCKNVIQADFEYVLFFSEETKRGKGGFGHTGN